MSLVYWSDPLGLVLLAGVLLVLGAIVARIAKRRRERSKNAYKP
jgi:hypothetical protein